MSRRTRKPPVGELTRRGLLKALAALGITGPLALDLVAQSRTRISVDVLRHASNIVGEEFSPERLAVIEKALQRNLDQSQLVRDLVIDDRVEPAPIFVVTTMTAGSTGAAPRRRR